MGNNAQQISIIIKTQEELNKIVNDIAMSNFGLAVDKIQSLYAKLEIARLQFESDLESFTKSEKHVIIETDPDLIEKNGLIKE